MDWLDQYLNGLGEYKTTVSPADTHIWGIKPKLNNVQERMQFDAAAQSEAEFRTLVQEARAELEEHGMSRDDVAEGIGSDPGSPTVQATPASAPAFPVQITLTGNFGFVNAAPPVLSPITDLSQLNGFQEITALAGVNSSTITTPYRVYLSTAPNASGGYDYIYLIYLELDTSGWYNEAISPGRWFIGNGYSFTGDNEGWYTNYGYYTALQSKSTPPSSNIANWTRIPGYYPNEGTITEISFAY